MKRTLIIILLFCMIGSLASAASQLYQSISTYYRVYTDVSETYSQKIANKMEACLKLFNSIFHFDLTELKVKLKVVIYNEKINYDAYLNKLLGRTRTDFVYIHYSDLVKSELVGYSTSDEDTFNSLLLHQGLIQFLKAYIPNAPIWLQEGIAAYIEASSYNESTGTFTLEKSMAWLETLKAIIKGSGESPYLSINELINIDKQTAITKINSFYPEVWGLVFFLTNSPDEKYNRLLWDSVSVLEPGFTLKENSQLVKNSVFGWIDTATMEKDFKAFIESRKTFQDHVQDGIDYYTNNDLVSAKNSFETAMKLKPTDYFPQYYLGLIEYTNKNYFDAKNFYIKALDLGADAGLTNYALGVNAYADNDYSAADTYLKESRKINAEKYWEKVQEILDRIEAENIYSGDEFYIDTPDATDTTSDATDTTPDTTDTTPDTTDTTPDTTDTTPDTTDTTPDTTDTSDTTDSPDDTSTDDNFEGP